jgi:hypothetical protein
MRVMRAKMTMQVEAHIGRVAAVCRLFSALSRRTADKK